MHFIAHRGNIDGPNADRENSPEYIIEAIELDFDVEVDLWEINRELYLGHDEPEYIISDNFLWDYKDRLWVHCKNAEAMFHMSGILASGYNKPQFFWHQKDNYTLTSNNVIWAYPGQPLNANSICVMPENANHPVDNCAGICSDYILRYRDEHKGSII